MLTPRTRTKIFAVCAVCALLLSGLITYVLVAPRLPSDWMYNTTLDEDAERFKSYLTVLPDVSYENIQRGFTRAHSSYQNGYSQTSPTKNVTIHSSYSELSKELNTYLYEVAQETCGDLYCGDIKLSPLLPLAEANLEGGRVDTAITFSAMAHSSVFTFESVEDLANLNVTDCLRDKDAWIQTSTEYYTRDRGPLQCNPYYGANDPAYGPSERELLDAYVAQYGVPDYGTNHDSCGNYYTVADWISRSRTEYGDRFNPASMMKIFGDEKRNVEIPGILKYFPDVQNEWQVYCIMAYCHWCGPGFLTMDRDMAYAGWKSVARADEYCRDISSPEAIEIIYSQCLQDIQSARNAGRNPVRVLDKNSGRAVFDKLHEAGVVKDWYYYFRDKTSTGNNWNQGSTACSYPVGLIYGVMQMNLLYSGY